MSGTLNIGFSQGPTTLFASPGRFGLMATGAPIATTASAKKYLGTNLAANNYYNQEVPWINVLKMASTNSTNAGGTSSWQTIGTATDQWGDLHYDADGYVTSLTGISSTVYTAISTSCCLNMVVAPGTTYTYPAGPYQFQFTGKGTITFTSGVIALTAISNTGTGTSTYTGLTITSPTTGVTTVTLTANQSTGGFVFQITAIPDSVNYPRSISLVQTALLTNFANGEIFTPQFLATLNGYSRIRTMDSLQMQAQTVNVLWGGTILSGSISASLMSYTGSTWVPKLWTAPTGTYRFIFNNGQVIDCACTQGSATVSFGTALTSDCTYPGNPYTPQALYQISTSWADRTLPSNYSYASSKGVPIEICVQLANALGVDYWHNYPVWVDSTYITNAAQLIHDGTGSSLSGFTGLNSSRKCFVELSNEMWNSGGNYSQFLYVNWLGAALYPSAGGYKHSTWIGKVVADIGDAWYATYGSSAFASRVVVLMPFQTAQGDGPYYLAGQMNNVSGGWGDAAYLHHVGGICCAPYIGSISSSVAITFTAPPTGTSGTLTATLTAGTYLITFDDNEVRSVTLGSTTASLTWTGALSGTPSVNAHRGDVAAVLTQADPLDTFFGLAYSNTYGGITYPSVDTAGWAGAQVANVTAILADTNITSQPWANLPVYGYESGTQITSSGNSAWQAVVTSAHRDFRMGLIYCDPLNAMYTDYGYTAANGKLGYFHDMAGVGITDMNHYLDISPAGQAGEFGVLESVMQPISPMSVAPYKYQGVMNYINGTSTIHAYSLAAAAGTYAVTGETQTLALKIGASAGSYAMTGEAATLAESSGAATTIPNLSALPATYPSRDLTGYAALSIPSQAAGYTWNDTVTGVRTVKITASGTPGSSSYAPYYASQGLQISQAWGPSLNQYTLMFIDVSSGSGYVCDYTYGVGGSSLSAVRALPSALGNYSLGRASFSRKAGNPHILYYCDSGGKVHLYDTTAGVMANVDSSAAALGYSASWPSTGWPWTTASSNGWFMVDATETYATAGSSSTYYILNLVTGVATTASDTLDDIYGGYGSPLAHAAVMTDSGDGPPYDITTSSFNALSPALTGGNWDGSTFSHMASLAPYWLNIGSNKGGGSMQMLKVFPDGTNNAASNVLWPKYWGQLHKSGHWWLQGGGANQYWLMSVDTDGTSGNSASETSALTLVNSDTGASYRVGFHYSASGQSGGNMAGGADGFTGSPGGANQYWSQSHGTISHDGKLILFGSNMGNQSRIDCFLMEVPVTTGTPPSFP